MRLGRFFYIMAENKKSVLLYCDIIHTVKSLSNEEAGKLFKHYLEYINDLNPVSDRLTELLFEPIKQNLKRDLKKWEDKSLKNKEIANIRWQKKDANACERIKDDAINADKVTVIVTDTVKDKVIVKENINNNFLLKKETKFDFRKNLIDYGFNENLVDDWIKVRKTKKATKTETAFKGFIEEIENDKLLKKLTLLESKLELGFDCCFTFSSNHPGISATCSSNGISHS